MDRGAPAGGPRGASTGAVRRGQRGGLWIEAVTGKGAFRAGRSEAKGRLEDRSRGVSAHPCRPNLPRAPAATAALCGRPFQTGHLSLPRWKASRVDAQSGEERAAQSGLSTGQGPSPGASKVPIDQATPERRPEGGGALLRAPGNPEAPVSLCPSPFSVTLSVAFFRYLVRAGRSSPPRQNPEGPF